MHRFFEKQCVKYVIRRGQHPTIKPSFLGKLWFKLCSKIEFALRK